MLLMKKRGQVTIFVLLGLVVVTIIVILLLFQTNFFEQEIKGEEAERILEPQLNPIKERVMDCVEASAKRGELLIAKQGGYLDPPYYVRLGDYEVSYGCYLSEGVYMTTLPLMSKVEEELQEYIQQEDTLVELNECFSLDDFSSEGFTVDSNIDTLTTDFDIGFSETTIKTTFPLTITKEGYATVVNEFVIQYPSGLGKAHYVASAIVNDECRDVEFDIPSFAIENPNLALIERQEEDDDFGHNTYYYLITIPSKQEDILKFHFIVQES